MLPPSIGPTRSTIILLNGISSAGKTSISRVLQRTMSEPYLQVSIDAFEDMLPDRYGEGGPFAWDDLFPRLLSGFHRSIAALADTGVNLLVDHVMVYREGWASTLADCVTVLAPFPVYFVGVRCSLEEAMRREQTRGDRFVGTAERQFPRVHRHALYDLEVDTTHASPEACAEQIRTFIGSHTPTAFARLRQMPRQSIPEESAIPQRRHSAAPPRTRAEPISVAPRPKLPSCWLIACRFGLVPLGTAAASAIIGDVQPRSQAVSGSLSGARRE